MQDRRWGNIICLCIKTLTALSHVVWDGGDPFRVKEIRSGIISETKLEMPKTVLRFGREIWEGAEDELRASVDGGGLWFAQEQGPRHPHGCCILIQQHANMAERWRESVYRRTMYLFSDRGFWSVCGQIHQSQDLRKEGNKEMAEAEILLTTGDPRKRIWKNARWVFLLTLRS